MKKILGLVASQRKLANGEILIKEVAASAGRDCQLELLRLADLKLDLCRGCYTCLIPGKLCPLDDDLYYLVEKIKTADGIILSAPCYILGPAAVTKVLGDRIIALAQLIDDLWGKPCVVIATAGSRAGRVILRLHLTPQLGLWVLILRIVICLWALCLAREFWEKEP